MQSKNQGKRRLVKAALTILVLTSAFVIVRFLWLDSMVTTDEPFWLGRSGNFYRALRSGDLVNTYQMAHPGVMTMWAGALAYAVKFPEFASLQQTNLDDVYSIERVLRSYGVDPLEMLVAAKISKILLQGVFFGIGVAFLFRLVKPTVGWLACGLLIVSPFLTGFDSILHVDGLFTTICFSALLSIVYASLNSSLRRPLEGDIGWWMIAGGLSACAWLTRTTGIVLFGVAGLCLILALTLSDSRHWRRPSFSEIMNAGLRFGVWAISASITTIILLPALWVDPKGILSRLWSWSSNAASEGHENPTFFMGEIHHGSPGWMVYPLVAVWRTTPVEWLGVAAFALLIPWMVRRQYLSRSTVRLAIVAIVFAAVYLLAMSVGAKKFDRYVLPIFPVIVLVAAIGIEGLVAFARDRDRLPKVHRGAVVAVSSLLVVVQALSMLTVSPYRLDYYNPILGGTRAAEDVLQMGWGQGGVEVVDTIAPLVPEGQSVVMQTSAVPSAFSYFLETDDSIRIESFGMSTPAGWYETDFYVAGIQQTQRDMAPSYRYLRDQAPFAIIDIGGVPYFSIFTPNKLPLPAHLQGDTACSGKFRGQVQLMQIIGRDQSIDFYWLSLDDGSASEDLTLQVSLVAPDGVISTAEATWTMAPEGVLSKANVTLDTDLAFPLEQYQLILSVTDVNGILPVIGVDGVKTPDGEFQTHSECYYQ